MPDTACPCPSLQAELTFCTGDIITVFGEIDEDGFYYVSWVCWVTPNCPQPQQHQLNTSLGRGVEMWELSGCPGTLDGNFLSLTSFEIGKNISLPAWGLNEIIH